jgi:hypothetical protein
MDHQSIVSLALCTLMVGGLAGCATSYDATVKSGQCPADTFPDNNASGKQSVTVSANADVSKQTGGAAVQTSGEGAARITCRQKCPSGAMPSIEESDSPAGGKVFRYHCDPVNGKPGSNYEEAQKPGQPLVGKVLPPS